MENMRKALLAQGLDATMVDSMLKSFKPKAEKKAKKSGWYPGMPGSSTKIDKEVLVTTYCQCCGSKHEQLVNMKAVSKDSPDTQKLACSVCVNCPEFIRQFTHEQLVSMILLAEKPAQELRHGSVRFRASLASQMSPEDIIVFTTLSDRERHTTKEVTENDEP